MLLKGAEIFQYNSFRSNLCELHVHVVNTVLILLGSLGTTTNYFRVRGNNSCMLQLQKQHWVALWEHCWQEKGKPWGWGKAGRFGGLHLEGKTHLCNDV